MMLAEHLLVGILIALMGLIVITAIIGSILTEIRDRLPREQQLQDLGVLAWQEENSQSKPRA
jgi:hypothetical protein